MTNLCVRRILSTQKTISREVSEVILRGGKITLDSVFQRTVQDILRAARMIRSSRMNEGHLDQRNFKQITLFNRLCGHNPSSTFRDLLSPKTFLESCLLIKHRIFFVLVKSTIISDFEMI